MTSLVVDNIPERMSFTLYWASRRCCASGLPAKAVDIKEEIGSRASNPRALLGRFFHSVIKAVADKRGTSISQGDALSEVFSLVVGDYERRYPDLNLAYEPYVERIYQTVDREIDFAFETECRLFVEEEISSSDQELFGCPDWVMLDGDEIELVDFKLSSNTERIDNEKNQTQIAYYAFLVSEAYGSFPSSAKLVGLSGVKVPVRLSHSQSIGIAQDAKALMARLTEAKRKDYAFEDLASPKPEVCVACKFRETCELVATPI